MEHEATGPGPRTFEPHSMDPAEWDRRVADARRRRMAILAKRHGAIPEAPGQQSRSRTFAGVVAPAGPLKEWAQNGQSVLREFHRFLRRHLPSNWPLAAGLRRGGEVNRARLARAAVYFASGLAVGAGVAHLVSSQRPTVPPSVAETPEPASDTYRDEGRPVSVVASVSEPTDAGVTSPTATVAQDIDIDIDIDEGSWTAATAPETPSVARTEPLLARLNGQEDAESGMPADISGETATSAPPDAAKPQAVADAATLPADYAAPARLMLHLPSGLERAERAAVVEGLEAAGHELGGTSLAAVAIDKTNVRFFHPADADRAARLASDLARMTGSSAEARDFSHLPARPREGTLEIWVAGDAPQATLRATGASAAVDAKTTVSSGTLRALVEQAREG